MEGIEAIALKSSCFSKFTIKSSSTGSDDMSIYTAGININGALSAADDFSVDEFFDLPTTDGEGGLLRGEDDEDEEKHSSNLSLSSLDQLDDGHSNSSTVVSASLCAQDLAFQVDDMEEELELWSHFMDDSVSDSSIAVAAYPALVRTGLLSSNRVEPVTEPMSCMTPCIPAAFPVRPRSKRPRKSRAQGPSPIPYGSSPAAGGARFTNPVLDWGSLLEKLTGRADAEGGGGGGDQGVDPRRCSHCQVQRTPQWRAGPLGPKTLCNACGVRFKKGRLYPEYRPACSPTFLRGVHSNSHRKVLEMRKRKEMMMMTTAAAEAAAMVVAEGKTGTALIIAGC